MFSTLTPFDKLLEKATNKALMEPDWETNIAICDYIRQKDIDPQNAVILIFRKLGSTRNPHSQVYALTVLESVSKNCGSKIFDILLQKLNLNELHTLALDTKHEIVRNKVLEIVQTWMIGMKGSSGYDNLKTLYSVMKSENFKFPDIVESDAMFVADTAPQWTLGTHCSQCNQNFTLLKRRHHCRACGEAFCHDCSSRTSTIPKIGYEKEVRVCNFCYAMNKPSTTPMRSKSSIISAAHEESDLPKEYLESSLAQQSQEPPPRKSEDEIREEEEFQLAMALSQSEAEHKEQAKRVSSSYFVPDDQQSIQSESNSELSRYLNKPYWDSKVTAASDGRVSPSAPTSISVASSNSDKMTGQIHVDVSPMDDNPKMNEFMKTLKTQVDIFVNRMKSNCSRGRPIANDSSVQTLFMTITSMHSQLLRYIQEYDDKRLFYEGLQDKTTQIKDARAALDALREEHREMLRQQAAEAERQRQMQMAQKLEVMRKKKEEYLQYQRQLALQRIQEQEREMIIRQEHQKQQYLNAYRIPGAVNPNEQRNEPIYNQYVATGMATNQDLSNNMQHILMNQQQSVGIPYSQIQQPIGLSITQPPKPVAGATMSQPQPQLQQYYPQMMQSQPMLRPTAMQQQPQTIAVEAPPIHFPNVQPLQERPVAVEAPPMHFPNVQPLQEHPVANSPAKVEVMGNHAVKHEEVEVEELISFD